MHTLNIFAGVDRIAFDDQSYSTKMSVFPSIDLFGNIIVKSI